MQNEWPHCHIAIFVLENQATVTVLNSIVPLLHGPQWPVIMRQHHLRPIHQKLLLFTSTDANAKEHPTKTKDL